jgi:hypothetical protein
MKKTIAIVTISLALMSSAATAQERTGDAALGALSGALVLGLVGAVAGAIVGYTAGPSIAGAWGLRHPQAVFCGGAKSKCKVQFACTAR